MGILDRIAVSGLVAVFATVALIGPVTPAAAQKYNMKLAIIVANDPLHEFIRAYKAKIEDLSGGRITAEQKWRDAGAEVIRLSAAEQKQIMAITKLIGDDILGARMGT